MCGSVVRHDTNVHWAFVENNMNIDTSFSTRHFLLFCGTSHFFLNIVKRSRHLCLRYRRFGGLTGYSERGQIFYQRIRGRDDCEIFWKKKSLASLFLTIKPIVIVESTINCSEILPFRINYYYAYSFYVKHISSSLKSFSFFLNSTLLLSFCNVSTRVS